MCGLRSYPPSSFGRRNWSSALLHSLSVALLYSNLCFSWPSLIKYSGVYILVASSGPLYTTTETSAVGYKPTSGWLGGLWRHAETTLARGPKWRWPRASNQHHANVCQALTYVCYSEDTLHEASGATWAWKPKINGKMLLQGCVISDTLWYILNRS